MQVVPTGNQILYGIYTAGDVESEAAQFNAKTGQAPAIVFTHHAWVGHQDYAARDPVLRKLSDPLENESLSPLELADQLAGQGSILAVSWDVPQANAVDEDFYSGELRSDVHAQAVIDGQFDDYIRDAAQEIKDFGKPIMLGLSTEFDVRSWFAYGADGTTPRNLVDDEKGHYGDPTLLDGPERIRDMHKHVIDLFEEVGATNVSWFMYAASHYMNPNHEDYDPGLHPGNFYPGDDYIDWVGQSAYYIDPNNPLTEEIFYQPPNGADEVNPTDLREAIRYGYEAWAEVTDKPIFLPEFGIVANSDADKSAAIQQIADVLPEFPNIGAFTLLDSAMGGLFGSPRIGSTPDELDMWQSAIVENAGFTNSVMIDSGNGPVPLDEALIDTGAPDPGGENPDGGASDDQFLIGDETPNTLEGGAGSDFLDGGADADVMIGRAGDDVYLVDSTGDTVIERANDGLDTIVSQLSASLGAHVENLFLSGSGDIDGSGNDLDNWIVGNVGANTLQGGKGADGLEGNDGDDRLYGNGGEDYLDGGAGADWLVGDAGADYLIGGEGDDLLFGGGGDDVLVGGAGNDIFVIQPGEGADSIYDYAPTEDYVILSHLGIESFDGLLSTASEIDGMVVFDLDPSIGARLVLGGVGLSDLDPAMFVI